MTYELLSGWKREREKWIGAAIGGLICLIWTFLPIFAGDALLSSEFYKSYVVINFYIVALYVFATYFLSTLFLLEKIRYPSAVIIRCCGAALLGIWCVIGEGFDSTYAVWYFLIPLIVAMIPWIGELFMILMIIVCIPATIFAIQDWQTVASIIASRALYQPLLLAAPSLLAIPASIFLGYESGGFIGDKLKKDRLELIEKKIKDLEEIVKKHEAVLNQRRRIEEQIDGIISLDPANLSIRADMFLRRAAQFSDYEIQRRMNEIELELQNVIQLEKDIENEVQRLESEKESMGNRLESVMGRLHKLEAEDRQNIQIKLQKLQHEWKNLNRKELENIETFGKIEHFYKEQLLLENQIKEIDEKIEDVNKKLINVKINERVLELEKLILQLEEMDRNIKKVEPQLLKQKDELEKLREKLENEKRKLDRIREENRLP